jgi:hypothetical protein
MKMLRNTFLLFAMLWLSVSCLAGNRTDREMFEAARQVFTDYMFEYGIDPALFSAPSITSQPNGGRTYTWVVKGTNSSRLGIEVTVTRTKSADPEWALFGSTDAWLPLVGSKVRGRRKS